MIPPVAPGQADEKQNMVGWKNTFNMRQISLMNLAASQMGVKNNVKTAPMYRRPYSISSTKSLDLLRKNLQNAINKDIDNIIKKYLDKFFQPAINNIRNNLGKDSVCDDHIKEVCRNMLDDAKLMYKNSNTSRDSSPYDYSDSEASLIDGKIGRGGSPYGKRKESDTDSDTNQPILNKKKQKSKNQNTSDHINYKLPIKRDGPKWNPNRMTEETMFIMGARANKVLGYGQTRGRLYVRHPNLVRYSGDQEDKEWLASKNLMPPSGGKAYLMLLEDIEELTRSDEYKNNPNLQMHELKGFQVPPFLLLKIKNFIDIVRTDKKMDLFDYSNHSAVTTVLDSLDTVLPESTSKLETSRYILSLPNDMSPNSNSNSISISSTLTPSPISTSSTSIMSNMMMLKENIHQDNFASILASHVNSDNSQDF